MPNSGLELELALIGFPMLPGSVAFTETVASGLVDRRAHRNGFPGV